MLNILNENVNVYTSDKLREAVENVEERLLDIQNLLQLLELSLLDNQDDKHIIRTVNVIYRFLVTLLQNEFVTLKKTIKDKTV